MFHSHIFGIGGIVGLELRVGCGCSDFITKDEAGRIIVSGGVTHLEGFYTIVISTVPEFHVQAVGEATYCRGDEVLAWCCCVIEPEAIAASSWKIRSDTCVVSVRTSGADRPAVKDSSILEAVGVRHGNA